jgi:lipopolysaccharide assembly protein A
MDRLRWLLTWVVRGLLFLFILLFAMKNTDPVALKFYFGTSWQGPLALVLFLTLVVGAILGLLAGLERVFTQRREILELKEALRVHEQARAEAATRVPPAASAADFDPRAVVE